jgi:hypothetical protein
MAARCQRREINIMLEDFTKRCIAHNSIDSGWQTALELQSIAIYSEVHDS